MSEHENTFGKMAKQNREAAGLSQSQLALEIGWKRQDLSAIERGLRSGINRRLRLAERLAIPVTEVKVIPPKSSPGRRKPRKMAYNQNPESLGYLIRHRRLEYGITQKEIAHAANQKSNYIVSLIESNKRFPSLVMQEALHETLGLTFEEIDKPKQRKRKPKVS